MTDQAFSANMNLLSGFELHQKVIQEAVLDADQYVWIATANLKDMHVPVARGYKPILEIFDRMAGRGVSFRIIHSDLPSKPFRTTFERFPRLISGGLELQICPRSHWKMVIVDSRFAYLGSANFTGAGLGAKREDVRNLELGITTEEVVLIQPLHDLFDRFWIGFYCQNCGLKRTCPDPIGDD